MSMKMSKYEQNERVFNHFDRDRDGRISPFELMQCVAAMGGELSEKEAEAEVGFADSDEDGLLGLEDFVKFIEGGKEEEKLEDLKEAFKIYDMKDEGCITPKSLKRVLAKLGDSKSIDQCKAMIAQFDLNGDGVLCFEEFKVMMGNMMEMGGGDGPTLVNIEELVYSSESTISLESSDDPNIMEIGGGGGDSPTLASSLLDISFDDPIMSPKACIFRTPKVLSTHNERAYLPYGFSFGPFHHGNPALKRTEKIKLRYLHELLSRTEDPRKRLTDLLLAVREIEEEARACYAEQVGNDANELVKMLVVDGCFLIEMFRKDNKLVPIHKDDPVFSRQFLRKFIYHDLILLENQVPWKVLQCLFSMTSENNHGFHLAQVIFDSFERLSFFPPRSQLVVKSLLGHNHKHILDLLRNSLILPLGLDKERFHRISEWQPILSATSMEEAGIKFRKSDGKSILDVKFKNGVLEIPNFMVNEETESHFRNLISYEQCAAHCRPIVTSYCILLDNLVNSTKDLDVLSKNQIVQCWSNPQDAAQLFNKLYSDAVLSEFYYKDICCVVNAYCQRRWPKWRAAYVSNPWAIASQLLGAALLLLAFLQTLYTIKK